MTTTTPPATSRAAVPPVDLLPQVERIVTEAGDRLRAMFSADSRFHDRDGLVTALRRNDEAASSVLRDALAGLRPGAAWLDDHAAAGPLPDGEFWVVDPVEGNVNHVSGLDTWAVSVALVRDRVPELAVVRQPVGDRTYTALNGGGATCDGLPLSVSRKTDFGLAAVDTGQAEAHQRDTHVRFGASITAMLGSALLVRAGVPSTFPLLLVASGRSDVFWQYGPTLPGIAAGILLVTEAGGVVTRIDGSPWTPGSPDVLVATPALHRTAVDVLATVG